MKLKCVIIDDEQDSIDVLTDLIKELPNLVLCKTYLNPVTALTEIEIEDGYEIIFIDVDMPGISGIELAKELRDKTRFIVFTTAHAEHAVDAFEVRADHYLLKPISLKKFVLGIHKLVKNIAPEAVKAEVPDTDFFIKLDQKKLIKIRYDEVVAVEGATNYVIIHTLKAQYVTHMTMKEMELQLSDHPEFMRVHKSHIISKDHIELIDGYSVKLKTGLVITISNMYKDNVFKELYRKTINPRN